MLIRLFGAAGEVTGSRYLISASGRMNGGRIVHHAAAAWLWSRFGAGERPDRDLLERQVSDLAAQFAA